MLRRWSDGRTARALGLAGALGLAPSGAVAAGEERPPEPEAEAGQRDLEAEPDDEQRVLELDEAVPESQVASGPVQAVDKQAGVLHVEGESFQAHPAQLENIEPGQMVSVFYGEQDGQRWVQELRVGAPAEEVRRDLRLLEEARREGGAPQPEGGEGGEASP